MEAKKPVEAVAVPVKAAATTAANVLALTAAAVASGGTAAMIAAAAGVAATGMAISGGKKAVSARSQKNALRSGASAPVRKGGTLPRMFRSGKNGAGAAGSRKAGSAGATGVRKNGTSGAGSRKNGTSGSSAPLRKPRGLAALRKNGAARRSGQNGAGAGTHRKASAPLRSLRKRASRVANSPARKWAGQKTTSAARALRTGTKSGSRKIWRGLRKFVQRKIMGRKPEQKKNNIRPAVAPLRTGTDLRSAFANGLINGPIAGTVSPARITPPLVPSFRTAVARTQTGGTMLDIARQMVGYAENYDAPGILEIVDELEVNLEGSLQQVSEAFTILSGKARSKWALDDAIVQKFAMISECLDTAAQMAGSAVNDIEIIHEAEFRRLRNPEPGQEKYDLSANGRV